MIDVPTFLAGIALVLGVASGLVAHEWSHALALRLAGIEYDIVYGSGSRPPRSSSSAERGETGLSRGPWAVVLPQPSGQEPAWHLRTAALMPLTLLLPLLVLFATGTSAWLPIEVATAATIGWLACAIPSPQDFSVAFHAHRALEIETPGGPRSSGDCD